MNNAVAQTSLGQLGPVSQAFRQFERESLAEGIGSSYGIIGYRGKTWTLRYKGEVYTFRRADDGTPAGHIDVVFLRQAKAKSRSYYKGFDPNAFEGKAPVCASLDGVAPDTGVTEPQAPHCTVCKRNEWYTNEKGIKTKDCTEYKRLAVLLLPAQTQPMVGGNGLLEPVFLRVPAGSLQALATYGEQLDRANFPFQALVTRITFDPDQSHPKFVFRWLQALGDEEAKVVVPLVTDQTALRVVGEDQRPGGLREIAPPAAPPPPAAPGAAVNTGFVPPATAAVAQTVAAPAPAPAQVQHIPEERMQFFGPSKPSTLAVPGQGNSLFGGGTQQPVTQAPPPPATQSAPPPATQSAPPPATNKPAFEDPTESDADLDALVANVLKAPA